MDNNFAYRGYVGSVETSIEDECLYGKILFIEDTILYEATTMPKLKTEFEKAVLDYLDICKQNNIEPKKTYSGTFNVRVGHQLHREIAVSSRLQGITINDWIKNAVKSKISDEDSAEPNTTVNIFKIEQMVVDNENSMGDILDLDEAGNALISSSKMNFQVLQGGAN